MEPEYIVELRRQLRRFVEEKAPRDKRQQWDRAHRWPRELFRELADMGLCVPLYAAARYRTEVTE